MQVQGFESTLHLAAALTVAALAAWHLREVIEQTEYRFSLLGVTLFLALAVGAPTTLLLASLLIAAALGRAWVRWRQRQAPRRDLETTGVAAVALLALMPGSGAPSPDPSVVPLVQHVADTRISS